uniref:Uncharacterized protein n=1 Tax=Thermogemmatispora argillosa TaxID=2045280 RepID=A0A455T5T3_9CHLR|nr:hypothetical protein KTA_35590 [Thermogemmatispora argillosa]
MSSKEGRVRLAVLEHSPMMSKAMMISKALWRCAIVEKLISEEIEQRCYACA